MSETTTSKAAQEKEELQKQIRELKKQNEEKDLKLNNLKVKEVVQQSDETMAIIANLQLQMEEMKRAAATQPVFISTDKKSKYRPVTKEDIGDDTITFTSRCTMKVIPGYMDENGVEVLAPHKMISLNYAASDIRQDGKEEEILNFCTYSTKLISEINFLKSHPEFGLTFGDNMNDVAGGNPKEYQFKTKAAEAVTSMSPESIIGYADMINVPNRYSMTNKQLKDAIVVHLVKEYVKEADDLQDKLKNRILEQAAKGKLN